MPQISKGDTFVDGQQVTGARLNQLVDSSILLVGSISEQTAIATNGVAATDELPINDSGVLKKAKASDLLNSGLSITTGTINGNASADLVLAPAAGQKVYINAPFEANSINSVGNTTVGGTLDVTGATTLTGGVASGFTVAGLVSTSSVPTTGNHLTNKTYVDGTLSTGASGYVRLPNGLILQWGSSTIGATTTFPIAFPNSCFQVVASWTQIGAVTTAGRVSSIVVSARSTTSFTTVVFDYNSAGVNGIGWFAIGN